MGSEVDEKAKREAEAAMDAHKKQEEEFLPQIDEGSILADRELRFEKNDQIEKQFRSELKQKTKLPEKDITKLVNLVFELVVEKETIIVNRECHIIRCMEIEDHLRREISSSRHGDDHLQPAACPTQQDHGKPSEMDIFLEENEIGSVEELQEKLTELNKLKREVKLRQSLNMRPEKLKVNTKSDSEFKEDSRVLESLQLQVKALENEKSQLEEENRVFRLHSGREKARDSCFDDTMKFSPVEEKEYEEKGLAKQQYQMRWDMGRAPEMTMISMMQQMHTEKSLPDPPKYTAEVNSTSLDAFTRTFKMKYGRLTDEQQVVLLEANFLDGKALKVFKSIADYEKDSFESIMAAMADRLRVSEIDESHRAKTRWEQLHRKENESVEDYCLGLDELAKLAFAGMSPRQVSAMKIAKLLNAIARNEHMASAVQDKIDDLPLVEQYEAARRKAIRMERAMLEREEFRQRALCDDRKGNRSSNRDNERYQKDSNQSKNSLIQSNNRNGFNSPSQNYQANPSNKNFQFSSSSPSSQPPHSNSIHPSNQPSKTNQQIQESNLPNQYQPVQNDNLRKGNENTLVFQGCAECKQIGVHVPSCSKAPKGSNRCFICQSPDHYARSCPQKKDENSSATSSMKNNPSVSTLEYEASSLVLNEVNASGGVGICRSKREKGKIAGVDVELMIDSGACISVMPEEMWKRIVEVKGKEWEKKVVKEYPIKDVVAANNEPIKLLFQVTLETSMCSKTEKIPISVAKVSRDNVILGFNNFEAMGIQLAIEIQPRCIRMMNDAILASKSQRIVEVQVAGFFSKQKLCLVHPLIDQLSAAVCQINQEGKSFLVLSNSGVDTVFLEKDQIIAHGEIKEFEVQKDEVFEESVSRSTMNEKKRSEPIGQKAVDMVRCQGPPLKSHVNSSSLNCLQERKDYKTSGSAQELLNVSPVPGLEKPGDVAVGGVAITQPVPRAKKKNRPRLCSKSQSVRDEHVIQDHTGHLEESSRSGFRVVRKPGKDPTDVISNQRELQPKGSIQEIKDLKDPPMFHLQYDQGSSMILHPMPSTST
ncbi:unnamed protein product [Caenorhabditis nigoni]